MDNKMLIPKNYLMLIAGVVWMIAGFMVTKIGYPLLVDLIMDSYSWYVYAMIVFLIFYFFIFLRLVKKHTKRIRDNIEDKMPFYLFFDRSSYIIMIFMIALGFSLRYFNLVPLWFIGFFYTGLGLALFLCGLKFVVGFVNKDVLKEV